MKIIKLKDTNQEEAISRSIGVLNAGGLVVYPTETCYGIAADPTNQKAVEKLLKYKKKRYGKAVLIAVSDKKMAKEYVKINEIAENIYDNYLPGPISVVSKSKGKVAQGIEADDGTLGVRIPDYEMVLKLVKKLGKPITSTSANVSYKKNPYSIQDILDNTSKKQQGLIDLIIDAGELPKRKPSTVINTTLNEIQILREGDVNLKSPTAIITKSERETQELAKKLIVKNKGLGKKTVVFALQGELGTGKTQFTKGLAKALGIEEIILSPTFVLVKEYGFKTEKKNLKLFHIDTYRLFEQEEFSDLGFEEMLKQPNVIAIEWAEKVSKMLRELKNSIELIWVKFEYQGENIRKIEYSDEIL
ncbi:MAG: threonylcarbamoyl-AMP synthase [Candidatus Aenigmarchaeota archaeon]|nr:threonylcarbamoyl-AMP synthase [Candidatus Aenigmarchaeota archaeon]